MGVNRRKIVDGLVSAGLSENEAIGLVESVEAEIKSTKKASLKKRGAQQLLGGFAAFFIGLIITLVGFGAWESGATGGFLVVAIVPMILGIIEILLGLINLIRSAV